MSEQPDRRPEAAEEEEHLEISSAIDTADLLEGESGLGQEESGLSQEESDPNQKESDQSQAFNPETGEINWDCPCLGGMAHGTCGEEFKTAFSCFVYSEEEPKGMDCIEAFKGMQECFRAHPEEYAAEIDDDDDDDDMGNDTDIDSDPDNVTDTDSDTDNATDAEEEPRSNGESRD